MKYVIIIAIICICILGYNFFGVGKTTEQPNKKDNLEKPKAGLIFSHLGRHNSATEKYYVTIKVRDTVLSISMYTSDNLPLFGTSIHEYVENWFGCWDENDTLWIYGRPDKYGIIIGQRKGLNGDCFTLDDRPEYKNKMPPEFIKRLPASVVKKWKLK